MSGVSLLTFYRLVVLLQPATDKFVDHETNNVIVHHYHRKNIVVDTDVHKPTSWSWLKMRDMKHAMIWQLTAKTFIVIYQSKSALHERIIKTSEVPECAFLEGERNTRHSGTLSRSHNLFIVYHFVGLITLRLWLQAISWHALCEELQKPSKNFNRFHLIDKTIHLIYTFVSSQKKGNRLLLHQTGWSSTV